MPQRLSGDEVAMKNSSTSVPRDQIKPTPVIDVRAIPLSRLGADTGAQSNVTSALESMEGPDRLRVASFTSAI
jgi:hypothetical protein